jgi:hypothetical protein
VGSISSSSLFNNVMNGIVTVEIGRNRSSGTEYDLGGQGLDVRAILEYFNWLLRKPLHGA